jgi:galactokinase
MIYKAVVPGRVNLIGEHTDYNQGMVMPAAIDLYLTLICEPRAGRIITVFSENYDQEADFSLDDLVPINGDPGWVDYIRAVCWALENSGYPLTGASLNISSSIPVGSGLSSSAALEIAVAMSLAAACKYDLSPSEMAVLCQKGENSFVGVHSGIMDQYAVALARREAALLLDCRNLHYNYLPLVLDGFILLIIDSRVKRSLAVSAYNRRRAECEEAVRKMSGLLKKRISSLRDVTLDDIKEARHGLPDLLYRRARYVVEENLRVMEAAEALNSSDLHSFGYLMNRSHSGLRDLYEVSCPELDLIVDTASDCPGVLGARMTGAGFGGCAVALIEAEFAEKVSMAVKDAFRSNNWPVPIIYKTFAAQGACLEGI